MSRLEKALIKVLEDVTVQELIDGYQGFFSDDNDPYLVSRIFSTLFVKVGSRTYSFELPDKHTPAFHIDSNVMPEFFTKKMEEVIKQVGCVDCSA